MDDEFLRLIPDESLYYGRDKMLDTPHEKVSQRKKFLLILCCLDVENFGNWRIFF